MGADTDLSALHSDKRWPALLELVKANREKEMEGLNKPLIELIDSLADEDQKWRRLMVPNLNAKPAKDSIAYQTIVRNCIRTDSLNYYHVKDIIAQYGFPGYDLVGDQSSDNFWLLVQHQDRHVELQEEVLAKMKVLVDSGKASASKYAYLVDRVRVNTGQLQVYGTQLTQNPATKLPEPSPVIEPEKLNERRKSMGLNTIEEYIAYTRRLY